MQTQKTLDAVKDYYGKVLSSSNDLKTSACCTAGSMPMYLRDILKDIHPDVTGRFYGCGTPFPPVLEGRTILDLGSGSGRDVYMLSKLVGPKGKVIGIDMTEEQLEVANKYKDYHADKFGYDHSNVEFIQGYIEDLTGAGIAENSIDLIVSNCVTNLSPDKPRLFSEIFKVLKPGGELYFSDVFADRRIPTHLVEDPILFGECLSGAMYTEDFRRIMHDLGCRDFRVIEKSVIDITNAEVEARIGMVNFNSITFRAFKMELEDRCEDYGQVAYYNGEIEGHPHQFVLDDHHSFYKNRPMLVCGNTADMLQNSIYGKYFKIVGAKETHYGLFDCGPTDIGTTASENTGACC